jgi:membrane protein DedA with SNARE-associated domain
VSARAVRWLVVALVAAALVLGVRSVDAEALEAWLAGLGTDGTSTLVLAGALAAATLVSEDLTCLAAGGLVSQDALPFAAAVAGCFVGILAGDVALFLCGRWLGPGVLARAPVAWVVDAERVADAARWLQRRGAVVILASRFLPGARLPTYFASGALGMGLGRFALWFAVAGLLWTPAVVGLAAGVGGGLARVSGIGERSPWLLTGVVAAAWLVLALAKSLATWRSRALLRGRLRRWTHFEYWPTGLLYLPVLALVAWKALRGRALEFSAANPALPHGGFVGESKRAIFARLAQAGAPVPRQLVLEAGADVTARRTAVRAFQDALGRELPLVVKPDAGQRGEGVRVVRDEAALTAALAEPETLIVQEHVAGEEYGVFYARHPDHERGELLSIVRKVLPEVVGDGRATLERLVLAHPEHRAMARLFLARSRLELERVPASGERVRLGELGTHCRGARFYDARELASDALLAELERIARGMPGFCFGRLDVRSASAAELRAGRFTILELNGVTSEAAHLYDPRFRLLDGWRTLLDQWRRAYAIGRANARRGARVSTPGELLAAVRGYRALAARRGRPGRPSAPGPAVAEARP